MDNYGNGFVIARSLFFDCKDCGALVRIALPDDGNWHLRKCPECPRTYWIHDGPDEVGIAPSRRLEGNEEMPEDLTYPYPYKGDSQ